MMVAKRDFTQTLPLVLFVLVLTGSRTGVAAEHNRWGILDLGAENSSVVMRTANSTSYDRQASVFVVTHGMGGTSTTDRFHQLAEAISVARPDSFVCLIDWSQASKSKFRFLEVPNPFQVAGRIDGVAKEAAKQLRCLEIDPSRMTLIGESFGNWGDPGIAAQLGGVDRILAMNPASEMGGYCPCIDWRTILALARYGGLRCPSELVSLRWTDVDLPGGKFVIHSSKTEHHSTGGVRVCPIFPELRPYLESAWDAAFEKAEFVITRYRSPKQNLRQTFMLILERAGITPWPKLFQNLRASRETELMARYPAKDVAAWLGNSVPVAMKHDAMVMDESFQAASNPSGQTVANRPIPEVTANGGSSGGSILDLPAAISGTAEATAELISTGESPVFIIQDSAGGYWLVGDTELESVTSSV